MSSHVGNTSKRHCFDGDFSTISETSFIDADGKFVIGIVGATNIGVGTSNELLTMFSRIETIFDLKKSENCSASRF